MRRGMCRKTAALAVASVAAVMALTACGVSQSDYDQVVAERDAAVQELEDLKTDYDTYKEKMTPFEEMTEAQAKAEKAKADQERKEIEEQEAAEKAAEEAAEAERVAAEEAAGYETGITYDQLARTPDEFKGKKVKFYGKVIQVMESNDSVQIRLAVDEDYDTILLGEYDPKIVSSRVLENDLVTVYGLSAGVITYKSTMGGNITIPGVLIERIDQ